MRLRRPRTRTPHDVLQRGPWLVEQTPREQPLIDAIDQLEELAALLDLGLLSRREFDRQKRKVLEASALTT
jgi:hypothetical protein